jgi:hypothetical protein
LNTHTHTAFSNYERAAITDYERPPYQDLEDLFASLRA